MNRRWTRGRSILAVLCACGAASVLAAGQPEEQADGERLREALVVQVLHRAARAPGGRLIEGSRREAADEAAFALSGEPLLLDAWAGLADGERVSLLVLPGAEALAESVESRILAARGDLPPVRRVAEPKRIEKGDSVLVLAAPAWLDGHVVPRLDEVGEPGELAAGAPARAFLLDLFEAKVAGARWPADALLAATDARAASLVAEYTLGARARGAIPPLEPLFRRHGIDRESVRWYRLALPRMD